MKQRQTNLLGWGQSVKEIKELVGGGSQRPMEESQVNFCSLSTLSGPHCFPKGHMPLNVRMNAVQSKGLISDLFRGLECIFIPFMQTGGLLVTYGP